jgi:hypothetical protein
VRSLKPMPIPPVPPDTVRVTRAAFPKGNGIVNLMAHSLT